MKGILAWQQRARKNYGWIFTFFSTVKYFWCFTAPITFISKSFLKSSMLKLPGFRLIDQDSKL
jgi:hypothetical protein